ncbi:MAG: hypothetical protein MUC43_10685 [Pirellula sp.]|jgi:hypothetical protein|nr:hypothetical protein [Pirellula sp.]
MKPSQVLLIVCVVMMINAELAFGQNEPISEPVANAAELARQISATEWLGPMSAIALSPFFGLACLTGIANFGPEWATQNSPLLGELGPMKNQTLFWVMLVLTIITSAPRFTKLSKPIVLLAETLESYSAIIILAVMKFSAFFADPQANNVSDLSVGPQILQAGMGELTTDLVFTLAAATNIIVINTIKLGCEFFVWLIPIPFVDSVFEAMNKVACVCLAALYVYSPTLSALLNLAIFAACALIFVQVTRYLRYFKYIFLYPAVRATLGYNESDSKTFSGFLNSRWKQLPSKTELRMTRLSGDRVEVVYPTWLTTYPKGIAAIKRSEAGLISEKLTILLDGEAIVLDVRKGTFTGQTSGASSDAPVVA